MDPHLWKDFIEDNLHRHGCQLQFHGYAEVLLQFVVSLSSLIWVFLARNFSVFALLLLSVSVLFVPAVTVLISAVRFDILSWGSMKINSPIEPQVVIQGTAVFGTQVFWPGSSVHYFYSLCFHISDQSNDCIHTHTHTHTFSTIVPNMAVFRISHRSCK